MTRRSLPAQASSSVTEKDANASGRLSIRQMAVVCGVPQAELAAEFERQRGSTPEGGAFNFRMPRRWINAGRARTASTGMADFADQIQVLDVLDTPTGRWVDRNGAVWTRTGLTSRGVPLMSTPGSVASAPQVDLTVQQVITLFGPLNHLALKVGEL